MRKSRFNESQRRAILASHLQGGKTVEAICAEHQISPATFYKWRSEAETERNDAKRRLKELEFENLKLKKMYAEALLKQEVLTDAIEILKKMKAQRERRR